MTIVLQFFPNGEFSQGVDTSHKRRDKNKHLTTQTYPLDPKRRDEYLQWREDNADILSTQASFRKDSLWLSPCGNDYTASEVGKDFCVLRWADTHGRIYNTRLPYSLETACFRWRLRPLVHQSVESCEFSESLTPTSSRKKLESMTKNMARNVRNGVYLLEQEEGGKDCLSFLTLTLPNLSTKGLDECVKNWDYLVKRFIDWLRTKIERKDMTFLYVYCTEIQTKRLEKRNEYAPHLHLVFRGRHGRKKAWVVTPKQVRKSWCNCIASVVNESFGRNAVENLQRVRHSAARYLSKYLSKGKCTIPQGAKESAISALKTQWAGMARTINKRIRANTIRFEGRRALYGVVDTILKSLPYFLDIGYISYFKKGFIPLHKCDVTGMEYGLHVCCGALSIPTYAGGLTPILDYCATQLC